MYMILIKFAKYLRNVKVCKNFFKCSSYEPNIDIGRHFVRDPIQYKLGKTCTAKGWQGSSRYVSTYAKNVQPQATFVIQSIMIKASAIWLDAIEQHTHNQII